MTKIGYFLSSEEFTPAQLLDQARRAEHAGFDAFWISDHFHPWVNAQGSSPFIWSVIGALSQQTALPLTTGVTCPTVRIHPAIVAQAAATSAVLLEGRFVLGVGSGEALNEQIIGADWPLTDERLEMLEEAVAVMRALWSGDVVTHHGRYYMVEHARLYTLPDQPPPIYVSGLGPKATELAGRIGDGYISTSPDAEMVQRFAESGGHGKPKQAGTRVCVDPDRGRAIETAHRLWPNSGLPGELGQVLRTPEHFEQATQLVTPDHIAKTFVCGADPEEHVGMLREYVDAGFDEIYVGQIGPNQQAFFDLYERSVLPLLRTA